MYRLHTPILRCKAGSTFTPASLPNLAAWYRKGVGQTDAGAGACSQWADQSGNGRHLKQATGAARPAIQGDGTILFDGTSDVLKCDAFTLAQPETVYLRMKQVTWVVNDVIFDGHATNAMQLRQAQTTPQLSITSNGTNFILNNGNLVLDTWGSVVAVFDGASSLTQVNSTTPVTGGVGAGSAGGFTMGGSGGSSLFTNIQVAEAIIYAAAHDQATRDQVIAYLNSL